ncbi:hypothetical protein [Desulfovibrio sp.]|uniref:hypothetical protein n=1 Tax=Desulfovibrio sp. TaxID=885 RepID=UPI0025BB24C0|nr:hypothetical protein [Desulfovibrio sp.]
MAWLKCLTDVVTRQRYLCDMETGISYRRTVGSLVWPCGNRNGCVTVLGESRSRQNVLGGRHDVRLLAEQYSADVSKLVDFVELYTMTFVVRSWATPLSDTRAFMLDDKNDERRRARKPMIRFDDPQGWHGKGEGLMAFYHALVQRRTLSEKTLFLGKDCEGANAIGKMQAEDMTDKPTDYPAAAALYFALAEIDLNAMSEWEDRESLAGAPADEIGGY